MKLSQDDIFNFIKCTEELNELGALLIHQVTNPNKRLIKRIEAEVGDVLYWVWKISDGRLDEKEIKQQINKRGKQYGEGEETF